MQHTERGMYERTLEYNVPLKCVIKFPVVQYDWIAWWCCSLWTLFYFHHGFLFASSSLLPSSSSFGTAHFVRSLPIHVMHIIKFNSTFGNPQHIVYRVTLRTPNLSNQKWIIVNKRAGWHLSKYRILYLLLWDVDEHHKNTLIKLVNTKPKRADTNKRQQQ